jgi:hypothetical protein
MKMKDIKTNFSRYIHDFSQFYSESLVRRVIIGIFSGIIVYLFFFVLTYILEIILWDSTFSQSLLHDFPLIGLICSFVVSLEVFGLIPHPPSEINDATEIVENNETE